MGGLSQATITNEVDGAICFKGTISLENNGGFSSVRYRFSRKDIARYTKLQIRLKGDGKRYQFRLKRVRVINMHIFLILKLLEHGKRLRLV